MTTIDAQQRTQYEEDGYLVLEEFVGADECRALRQRSEELMAGFDPSDSKTMFSTREQARKSDDYFLESGDRVRFFFEEDALAADGTLLGPKEQSINKIGHALHDLDPVFDRFSRTPDLASLAAALSVVDPV